MPVMREIPVEVRDSSELANKLADKELPTLMVPDVRDLPDVATAVDAMRAAAQLADQLVTRLTKAGHLSAAEAMRAYAAVLGREANVAFSPNAVYAAAKAAWISEVTKKGGRSRAAKGTEGEAFSL